MVLTMAVSLYTSRVVLAALGVDDYGIYNVVGGIVAMFGFLNGAMSTSTQRYLTFELGRGDKEQLSKVFATSINIHILIALVVVILAETVGLWFLNNKMTIPADRMPAAQWVYQFSIASTAVLFISIPYNAIIIAHEKMSAFAYISILEVLSKLVIVIALTRFGGNRLIFYAALLAVLQIVLRLVYGIYCRRNFEEVTYRLHLDKSLTKEMLGFSMWNLWGSFSSVCMTQGLNIVLNMFYGPAINAASGIAVQVQGAVMQFAQNFQMALNPQIIKYYAKGELDQMHMLVCRSSRFSFCLLLCICLPIFIEAETLLGIWLKEVPEYSAIFLRLILCVSVIQSVANPLMTSAQATGKVKVYQSVVGGIQICSLPAGYVALRLCDSPEWVFITEIGVVVAAFVVRLLIIRPMIRLRLRRYFSDVIVRCIITGTAATAVTELFKHLMPEGSWYSLAVCTTAVIFSALATICLGMTDGERHKVLAKTFSIFRK